jgi:NADH/NAD ratio-sensing transcriptional regulator Rex
LVSRLRELSSGGGIGDEVHELGVEVSSWLGLESKVKVVMVGMKVMSCLMLIEFLPGQ